MFRRFTLFVVALALLVSLTPSLIIAAPGDLDPSFGTGGTAISYLSNVKVNKVVVQPDGKIIVIGKRYMSPFLGGTPHDYLMVRRYTATGSLDTVFSTTLKRGIGYDAEVQADGKLVVIGHAPNEIYSPLIGATIDTTSPVVWRFNPNGTTDTSFGTNGSVFINTIATGNLHIEVFDSRVVIGYSSRVPFFYPSTVSYKIARLSTVGAVDFTRTLPFTYFSDEKAFSMKIDPLTGDIIAAGIKNSNQNAVLVRYTFDNAVVAGFGVNGEAAITDCSPGSEELLPKDLAILPDGKMLVYRWKGYVYSYINVTRMSAGGAPDLVCVSGYAPPAIGENLFVQPDGKFFFFLVAFLRGIRYFPDGTSDVNLFLVGYWPSAMQPDQKMVAVWAEDDSIHLERRLLD